jgi:hypothetical protein
MSLWLGERENREGRVPRSQRGITSGSIFEELSGRACLSDPRVTAGIWVQTFRHPAGLQRSRVRSVSEAPTGEEFGLPHLPGPRRWPARFPEPVALAPPNFLSSPAFRPALVRKA